MDDLVYACTGGIEKFLRNPMADDKINCNPFHLCHIVNRNKTTHGKQKNDQKITQQQFLSDRSNHRNFQRRKLQNIHF